MSDFEDVRTLLLSKLDSTDNEKIKSTMQTLLDQIETHNALDHDFVELLHILADGDNAKLYDVDKYANVAEEVKSGSTVIYFKSAGVFRVYQREDLDKYFVNRSRTNYRGQEMYEVVDDEKPQKIVIIIDSRNPDELDNIKQYIIEFSKETSSVSEEDLIVFDNVKEQTYEIIVKCWIAANSDEKNARIQKLLKFISSREKSAVLSNKLTKVNYSNIPNTSMVSVPSIKQLLSPFTTDLDGFISQFEYPVNINLTINNGPVNNIGRDMNVNNSYSSEDNIDAFIEHLENADVDWYEPGNKVKYAHLYNEYTENIGSCSKKKFTQMFTGKIFTKPVREQINKKRDLYVKIL